VGGSPHAADPAPALGVDSNVSRKVPPEDEPELLDRFKPFEMPDPPSVQGVCNRCDYHGTVYPGRYGGQRCAVCFGLQHGWMPRG
jgi:hypothetical protein